MSRKHSYRDRLTRPEGGCRILSRRDQMIVAWQFPEPGGEPLWRPSRRPREFLLNASPAGRCKNRRLPGTTQRFATLRPGCKRIGATGKSSTPGDSREPPVARFFGRIERWNKHREVAACMPKRLPSGRWELPGYYHSVPSGQADPLLNRLQVFRFPDTDAWLG